MEIGKGKESKNNLRHTKFFVVQGSGINVI